MPILIKIRDFYNNQDRIEKFLLLIIIVTATFFLIEILGYIITFKIREFIVSLLINHNENDTESTIWAFLLKNTPSDDFFAAIIGLQVTLISIAIPISFGEVARSLETYKDKEIHKMFVSEFKFKQMLWLIVILAFGLFCWYFFYKCILIGFFLLIIGIYSLYAFYGYIIMVLRYITETDEVVTDNLLANFYKIFGREI